jgi:hypothetical protein
MSWRPQPSPRLCSRRWAIMSTAIALPRPASAGSMPASRSCRSLSCASWRRCLAARSRPATAVHARERGHLIEHADGAARDPAASTDFSGGAVTPGPAAVPKGTSFTTNLSRGGSSASRSCFVIEARCQEALVGSVDDTSACALGSQHRHPRDLKLCCDSKFICSRLPLCTEGDSGSTAHAYLEQGSASAASSFSRAVRSAYWFRQTQSEQGQQFSRYCRPLGRALARHSPLAIFGRGNAELAQLGLGASSVD